MLSTLQAAARPFVFLVLFTMGSAGVALADYGGTDPPKTHDAAGAVSSAVDEAADISSVWIQLGAMFVRWVAAME